MKRIALFSVILVILVGLISVNWKDKSSDTNSQVDFKYFDISIFSLKIQLPVTTETTEDYHGNEEVLFSAFLNDETLKYWGYIQIWQIPDLEEFLQNSKSQSSFQFNFYKKHGIEVNTLYGIEVNWSAIMQNERQIAAREILLRKPTSDEVLMVSLFAEGKEIPSNLLQIFDSIISSLKWRKSPEKEMG